MHTYTIPRQQDRPFTVFERGEDPAIGWPSSSNRQPLTNNFGFSAPGGSQQWTEMGKADVKLTNKNRISVLVQYDRQEALATVQPLPEPYGGNRPTNGTEWMGQLNDTHVLSATLLNTFALGFTRNNSTSVNPSQGTDWTQKAGITGLPSGSDMQGQFPDITFSGGNATPYTWNGAPPFAEISYAEVIQDNVQWIKNNHAFTFGGQLIWEYEQLSQPSYWSGAGIGFSNTETGQFNGSSTISATTGDPFASYLLGLVDSSAFADTAAGTTGGRWQNYALYAQDDWKINRKLTLNLGLRYIIPKPFTEAHDRWSDFNPNRINPITGSPGVVQFGGYASTAACYCHTDVDTHYLTFGPRAGFAYTLNDKTVVRASFAMVHFNGGMLGGNGTQQGPGVLGFASDPSFTSTNTYEPAFILDNGYQNPTIYPGTTGNTTYVIPPFFSGSLNTGFTNVPGFIGNQGGYEYSRPKTGGRAAYTEEWNLTIERQLPASMVLNLTYAGTGSHFDGMDGGNGIYSNQVAPGVYQLPGLGGLFNQPFDGIDPDTNQTYLADAQAIYPGATVPYANFAGTIGQMLRPFPQFSATGPVWNGNPDSFSDFGTNSYNALQATVTRNMKNGLYLFASYAWSKEMDEAGATVQFFEQNARSAYDWNLERSPGLSDTPQSFSFAEVYELPIGRGKLVNVDNPVANQIIGGWKLAGAQQYSQGNPFSPVAGNCTPDAYGGTTSAINPGLNAGCYADYNKAFTGDVKLKKLGTGNPKTDAYFDANAFTDVLTTVPIASGNTPRTLPFPSMHGEFYKEHENVSQSQVLPVPVLLRRKCPVRVQGRRHQHLQPRPSL